MCLLQRSCLCRPHVENIFQTFLAASLLKVGHQVERLLPVADLRFTFFQGEAPNSRDAAKLLNSYFRFLGRERIVTFLYEPVFKLKRSLNVCLGKIRPSEVGFSPIQTQHCRDWQQNPSWDLGLRRLRICYLFHRGIFSQERPGRLMFLAECVRTPFSRR